MKASEILLLLSLAEKVAFTVGNVVATVDTSTLTKDELATALDESKDWPAFEFQSPNKG